MRDSDSLSKISDLFVSAASYPTLPPSSSTRTYRNLQILSIFASEDTKLL